MRKSVFHSNRLINDDFKTKNSHQKTYLNQKNNTDINKLLNRVKLNQLIEKKQKIIFCSSIITLLAGMGLFISIIK